MFPAKAIGDWASSRRKSLEAVLGSTHAHTILLLLGAVIYLLAYLRHNDLPGNHPTHPAEAWWGWWDQSQYLKTARAIATGTLGPDTLWYPVGYSLLAAPFWLIAPKHAFFLPDLFLVLAFVIALWKIARLHVTRIEALLIVFGFCALHPWTLRDSFVIPWNSIPTAAAFAWGIWILLSRPHLAGSIALSCIVAAAYWFRPADAFSMAPMLVASVLRLSPWRDKWRAALAGMTIVAVSVAGVGLLHLSIFGTWQSNYDRIANNVGFLSLPFSLKCYWLLVDPSLFFLETFSGLLIRFPWLMLAPAAIVTLVHRHGWPGLGAVSTILLSLALYVSFNDFHPLNVLRFKLIHYIAWTMPVLFIGCYVCLTRGWRHRLLAGAVPAGIGISVLILSFKAELRPVALEHQNGSLVVPAERPLVLEFPGVPQDARPQLTLDGKPARPFQDYLTPWQPQHLKFMLTNRYQGRILEVSRPEVLHAEARAWVLRWTLASPLRHWPANNPAP